MLVDQSASRFVKFERLFRPRHGANLNACADIGLIKSKKTVYYLSCLKCSGYFNLGKVGDYNHFSSSYLCVFRMLSSVAGFFSLVIASPSNVLIRKI